MVSTYFNLVVIVFGKALGRRRRRLRVNVLRFLLVLRFLELRFRLGIFAENIRALYTAFLLLHFYGAALEV